MNKNRSSIIITAAITVAAALLIGVLIPVMSDGARFGGSGSADLSPAVQATLAARQAVADASAAPDLTLFTPTPLAGSVQVAEAPALPAATDTPAATVPAATALAATATAVPEPTATPAGEMTVEPTVQPIVEPTIEPTLDPAAAPTSAPSAEATETPLAEPTPAPEGEATAEPIVTETAPVDPGAGGVVTVTITAESGMNVRSGPSTAATVLTALPNAAVVPAVGRTADSQWIQIYLADLNANGWLFASLVAVEGDLAALPVVE